MTLIFKRPLRKHQKEALERFQDKNAAALFHDLGTGKTTTAIALLRAKYKAAGEILPTLIISPVATLYNWENEFKINAPERVCEQVSVLYGTEKQRLSALKNKSIFIMNPEALQMKGVVQALQDIWIKCIVIDEVHRFKNHKSVRFKVMKDFCMRASSKVIMTGTPILNSYLDLWAQFFLLDNGETLGNNFYVFRNKYFIDKNARWAGQPKYFPDFHPKPNIEQELSEKIASVSSRVLKSECLDLPAQVFQVFHVELSKEQSRVYEQMKKEMIAEIKSGVCMATNALTKVLRLLQIISGHLEVEDMDGNKSLQVFEDIPRLSLLKEILEEHAGRSKIIVWCTFRHNYAEIARVCDELKLPYATLTGETKDRQEQVDYFNNDPSCRVMMSNPQAGGTGTNLIASDLAVYYTRNFSLGDRLQSEARNHRGGSEIHKTINVIDIVAKDTIDEDVLGALLRKENFADNVLNKLKEL